MMALLKLMDAVSDFLMLNFYPNKNKRDAFFKFKIEESVDYSDKGDRIDVIELIKEARKQEVEGIPDDPQP